MTEWLIHFTRNVNATPAREVLRQILIEGVLRPGFALRGVPPRPTIYGPVPAVAFTEQPIAAFLNYLSARFEPGAISGYGLLIHKHDVFVAGGLPVIYGLEASVELKAGDPDYDLERRLLKPSLIPFREQYRYVAFAPTRTPDPLDWSHEREWRWSASKGTATDGLFSLGAVLVNGAGHRTVHAIVEKNSDVSWLQAELRQAHSSNEIGQIRESNASDWKDFWLKKLRQVQIISLETAQRGIADGCLSFSRFENFPDTEKHPLL
jgi:hypothetical protein